MAFLPALAPVGGHSDGTDAVTLRQQRQQRRTLVVGVRADGHKAGDRFERHQGFVKLDDAALTFLLSDAGVLRLRERRDEQTYEYPTQQAFC